MFTTKTFFNGGLVTIVTTGTSYGLLIGTNILSDREGYFAVWNLSNVHELGNLDGFTTWGESKSTYRLVILTLLSKLKEFWMWQAVVYTVKVLIC